MNIGADIKKVSSRHLSDPYVPNGSKPPCRNLSPRIRTQNL